MKKLFLRNSNNSQENTRVPFLVKFQVKDCNFIKKRLQHSCFPVKYAKFIVQNMSNEIKSSQTELCCKWFITIQLADYLMNHSMFLFEIKERTPHVLLMLKTLSLSLWTKTCRSWLSSFKVILIDCLYRIFFCFSHSVFSKVS